MSHRIIKHLPFLFSLFGLLAIFGDKRASFGHVLHGVQRLCHATCRFAFQAHVLNLPFFEGWLAIFGKMLSIVVVGAAMVKAPFALVYLIKRHLI